MASTIYNSFWEDVMNARINLATVTVKVLLTTSGYTENKDTHLKRSDVTSEVAAGNGYTAGGATVVPVLAKDTATDRMTLTLPGATWTTAAGQTLTARKAVYYVSVGTAATDMLISVNDFGTDQTATNGGPITLAASTITLQN